MPLKAHDTGLRCLKSGMIEGYKSTPARRPSPGVWQPPARGDCMSDRTCTIDGCSNKDYARKMCGKHYRQWLMERRGECSKEGCTTKVHARDLCKLHYQQHYRSNGFKPQEFPERCTVEGCEDEYLAQGYCNRHYKRWQIYGDPTVTINSTSHEESFAKHTEWQGDCLIWTGFIGSGRYGRIRVNGEYHSAHRYAWETAHGPIPEGMYIDHKCWNTACVNVDHLRLATPADNSAYRSGPSPENKSTGIRNVRRSGRGFQVVIKKNNTNHYFGTHYTIEEAAEVAEQARKKLFGEFAGRG